MNQLTSVEQAHVFDAILVMLARLRGAAEESGDTTSAKRLDDAHSSADDTRQRLLWSMDERERQRYERQCERLFELPGEPAPDEPKVTVQAKPKKSVKRPQARGPRGGRAPGR